MNQSPLRLKPIHAMPVRKLADSRSAFSPMHVEESEEEKLHNKMSMKIESTEASMSLSVRTESERKKKIKFERKQTAKQHKQKVGRRKCFFSTL
jgi:hypothetical protein